jgi:hypothetical protein
MMEQDTEQQVFALRILKTVDKKTGRVNMEIKSENRGLTDPEVFVLVEGWLKKTKKKFMQTIFGEK